MALHHLHRRTRAQKLEPYPATTFGKYLLDMLVLCVGVVGPLMVIPQVWLIYSTHNAAGVSALSWFSWSALDIPWIIYGLVHRDRAITVTYTLWCIGNGLVAIGAVLYG